MPDEQPTQVTEVAEGGVTETQVTQETLGWKTEIPGSLREHEAFAPYKTKDELWNGHIEAVSKIKDLEGKLAGAIPKLSENATADEKAAYLKAIGVPEKAEDYEIELKEGEDNALAPWFKEVAHKLGMPKDTAKGLSAAWNEMISRVTQAEAEKAQKDFDTANEELKKTWGNEAEANAETVKRGYKVFSDNPALQSLMDAEIKMGEKTVKVGNHPGMVNLILEIGKKVSPDTLFPGGPSGGPTGNLDEQAKAFYRT
jgi:hypothetical protein